MIVLRSTCCVRHAIVSLAICALAATTCAQEGPLFKWANPTWSSDELERWLDSSLEPDAPEAEEMRELFQWFSQEWINATADLLAAKLAHEEAVDEWRIQRIGPEPPWDLEIANGMNEWKYERFSLENAFLASSARVLEGHATSDSWTKFVADTRRSHTLADMQMPWDLPLPDLVELLQQAGIDTKQPAVERVTEDYRSAIDNMILSIQERYYRVEAKVARTLFSGDASQDELDRIDTRPEMIRPMYQLQIVFADAYLNAIEEPDRSAFEQAWIALWFPDLRLPTPAELAIGRLRQWLPADDRRVVMMDEIARSYQQRELSIDRRIMQLNPPENQLRKRFDPDETEEVNEEFIRWFDEVEDLPYAIWQDEIMTEHVKRLKLTTDTCSQLRDMFTAEELPPDVLFVLSCVVLPDA